MKILREVKQWFRVNFMKTLGGRLKSNLKNRWLEGIFLV